MTAKIQTKPFCYPAIVILLVIAAVASCNNKQSRSNKRPDVLIILVDALRADHLDLYGGPINTAPFLTKWAKDGMVFDQAWAQSSWTKSSVASLFTSTYVSTHGVLTSPDLDDPERPFNEADVLSPHAVTLAEALQQHDYQTAAFTTNYHIVPMAGFQQGFKKFDIIDFEFEIHKAGSKVNQAFLDWTSTIDQSKPFFAYLHYMDVHGPYLPPEGYKNVFMDYYRKQPRQPLSDEEYKKLTYLQLDDRDLNNYKAYYDAQILYWDHLFSELWNEIQSRKLDKNLIVVVLADHGEAFFDHGQCDHGYTLHTEETRVPLVFHMPGSVQPGRSDSPVALIDVAPTILSMAGIEAPKQYQGERIPAIVGGQSPSNRVIESELRIPIRGNLVSVLKEGRHWIFDLSQNEIIGVYDLKGDFTERQNLIGQISPEQKKEMKAWFLDWLETQRNSRIPPAKVPPNLKLDTKSITVLRGLGYIQ